MTAWRSSIRRLEETKRRCDSDALIAAMKGMSWIGPRGQVSIDPETRDIVQNMVCPRGREKDDTLYNVEFETMPNVKDPYKAAKH